MTSAAPDLSLLERALKRHGSAKVLGQLGPDKRAALLYLWRVVARPKQIAPPGDWRHWFIQAGRGFGKTRSAAEWIRGEIDEATKAGKKLRIALVAPTPTAARDVMIEGESGLLSVFPEYERPKYEPAKKKVRFVGGHVGAVFSAFEPGALRGPAHDRYWAEELAAWKGDRGIEAWSNLMLGLRRGTKPRGVITSTPKPVKIVRDLLKKSRGLLVTRGSTYENRANLADAFIEEVIEQYEGTSLGAQELHGELLDSVPGALWKRALIEDHRVEERRFDREKLIRVVVAVDPAVTSNEDESSETGIVVVGIDESRHLYVLGDYSGIYSPDEWASKVWSAYLMHEADRVVCEVNQGGDLVETVLRTVDQTLPIQKVRASVGKRTRAEPIAALYEQGKVHHVGAFDHLEDQMCGFVPGLSESPDRLDALVWGASALALKKLAILT